MNALPPEMVFARPHIGLFHAWYLFASGQQDSAEAALQAVESALAGADNPDAEPSIQDSYAADTPGSSCYRACVHGVFSR